ncbi:hypothetical protein BLOT_015794 [Blomia tropicalis]|nr:hypothetical protein BLOT_015794 [Blomia tropicalis]
MSSDEIKIVPSQKNKQKICIGGYMFHKNRQRDDVFYWKCDSCKSTAGTKLVGDVHTLRYHRQHDHAPDPTQAPLAEIRGRIKAMAGTSRDGPSRIIQDVLSQQADAAVFAGSRDSLRQVAKRARRSSAVEPEPASLSEIDLPQSLTTLNGLQWLISDVNMDNGGKILIFGTAENMRRLQASPYFIMDGTFDTSPNIFRQLYTIHGSVGVQQECAKILPLVYALMSEKSCEYYIRLFEEVSDFAASEECELAPQFIIADFEQAAITAARRVFPMATINGCYFHFGQSIWRKIQDTGLATRYGTDIEFAIRLRMLIGLAFLPPSEIPAAFAEVSRTIGDDAEDLIKYFDEYYVNGRRRILRGGRSANSVPLYPPSLWSVAERVELALPRTQKPHRSLASKMEIVGGFQEGYA